MESDRTSQDIRDRPLQADPEPDPDIQDPRTKGGASYRTTLPLEDDAPDEEEPDRP